MARPEQTIIIGTRGSELALRQTQIVVTQLQAVNPQANFEIRVITTSGDRNTEEPIQNLGIGVFTKELEAALLRHEIDLAVHSMKDLPSILTSGLRIGAVPRREDPRDALVNRWNKPLGELPAGARIGTGSPRRTVQLLKLRPDLQVLPIRGNVPTRVKKARSDEYDGVVVALAGLRRLALEDEAAQVFQPDVMVPAPGQGALAVEVRDQDPYLSALLVPIQDTETTTAVTAERKVLARLGAGCSAPFGAHASAAGDMLTLTAMLADETGEKVFRVTATGNASDPESVGEDAFRQLVESGATDAAGIYDKGGAR